MDRALLIYADLAGSTILVGRMWARVRRGKESATFEYEGAWLRHVERFALEPALTLGPGPQHTPAGRALFGAIGDSAPDRWGRLLMRRAERMRADREGQPPATLLEADYLLLVDDESRQGALRFAEHEGGPFLAPAPSLESRRWYDCRNCCRRASGLSARMTPTRTCGYSWRRGRRSGECAQRRLFAIATAPLRLQNSRTRMTTLMSRSGRQWRLSLAGKAGIRVPKWRIEKVAGRTVLLLGRFDRLGGSRIPFLSAMSMLGAVDNESHSYLEMVDAIRQYGSNPLEDTRELWRRIVFNVLVSNTDDHLRNHGFLYEAAEGMAAIACV